MSGQRPVIMLIAGFGDNASMYAPLEDTELAQKAKLYPINLPGFGAPALDGATTLEGLACWVALKASELGATIIVAHSVASIIASLAATQKSSAIRQIISLEGNLTAADAYFSGRAAEHDDPESFRNWFLPRITARGESDLILARYAKEVAKADPQALWELGCDARRYSEQHHPGEALMASADVTYVLNRGNCAEASLDQLDASGMNSVELAGASHWPSLDRPKQLSAAIISSLI